MKNKNLKKLLGYDLQLFADDSGNESGDAGNNGGSDQGSDNNDANHGADENHGSKTFTQEQVSGMMAKEKNEGKRSILKSLGFKSEEDAKEAIKKYNEYLEAQKTEAEKQQEALNKANSEKDDALNRAKVAENKIACFNAGINPDCIDDVLAIASTKVTDEKDLDTVLKEMKEDKKYESFFGSGNSSNHGTGSNAGHSNSGSDGNGEDYAKKLAEKYKVNSANKKSSFFND